VRFQVFKDGKVVDTFKPCGAYLFGTDGISVRRAKIVFKKGCIECIRPNLETAGLALLWPIEGFGRILLPTTCLPERKRPYNLNVEITRAKLMQVTNRREDWSFFDNVEGMEEISRQSQDLFIDAIQHIGDPAQASRLADEALRKAMVYSEKLAVRQGKSVFDKRRKNHGFSRGSLGCRVNPALMTKTPYLERLLEGFNSVTVPINWAKIERRQGHFDFSEVDPCITMLGRRKVVLSAGPLLRFSKDHLPDWLLRSGMGFEKTREMAYQFVSKVVTRYASVVHRWYVISGLNSSNQFNFNFEQILEMTRAANMAVRAAGSRAVRVIEVGSPWGEYYATTPGSIPPFVYMDMVVQSGTSFDAFGLQVRFGKDESGMHLRDMMQISSILDCFAPVAKPLHITDVEIPSEVGTGPFGVDTAGMWHRKWDQTRQSQWLERFYKIALSKPFVESVSYGNLVDTDDSVVAHSGLLTEADAPKEAFDALKRLHLSISKR
jgi:glycosyl hydrolase family 10